MPEGPEVRKYADALDHLLTGRIISSFEARTTGARKWLEDNERYLIGQRVERVISHGKHLIGYISGDFFFHSHLMMWGRWQTVTLPTPNEKSTTGAPNKANRGRIKASGGRTKSNSKKKQVNNVRAKAVDLPEKDRRERARIVVEGGAAILLSAPIFNVGKGDPYKQIEILSTLGPDALPYRGSFNTADFCRRLSLHQHDTIGAALLNQQIVAGLGNYLRAEVLFTCGLNPWLTVGDLTKGAVSCLTQVIPQLASDAYRRGATATEPDRQRMASDPSLVYQPDREYGTRHMVFRRTNLPCLRCGEKIRQLRQKTYNGDNQGEERTRIVYFCAHCQRVDSN